MSDHIGFGGVHDVGCLNDSHISSMKLDITDKPSTHWDKTIHSLLIILSSKTPKLLSTDELRLAVESLDEDVYRSWPFYDKWAISMTKILLNKSVIQQIDLDKELYSDLKTYNDSDLFVVGSAVRVKPYESNISWRKPHIRCPGYLFNLNGQVVQCLGYHNNPSFLAYNGLAIKQPLYKVRFNLKDIVNTRYYQNISDYQYNDENDDTVDADIYHDWLEIINVNEIVKVDKFTNQVNFHLHDNHSHDIDHNNCCEERNVGKQVFSDHTFSDHNHLHDNMNFIESNNHVHDNRDDIEFKAVESEPEEGPGKVIGEAMIRLLLRDNIINLSDITATIEKLDMLKESMLGSKLVARAWIDEDFKERLLKNAKSAALELGINVSNPNAPTDLIVVENTDTIHNVVVCTLCSCYPVVLLGLSPSWYKSINYRARIVREPRKVLEEFGTVLPETIKSIRVHDSTADMRYLVLPRKPNNISTLSSEEDLRKLITRDSMIGVTIL